MTTPRVSRQQAELLKKVGYSYPNTDRTPFGSALLPTLDEAARWLREVKRWHVGIVVNPTYIRKYMFVVIDLNSLHKSIYKYTPDENENTHDLALSAGIDLILKKLEDGTE